MNEPIVGFKHKQNSAHPKLNIKAALLQELELPAPKGFSIPDEGSGTKVGDIVDLRLLFDPSSIRSVSGPQLNQALRSLQEVFDECSGKNWDGYNSIPISQEAYFEAETLLKLLPSSLPLPEIVPEPTGKIGLEWYKEKHYVYVVSVSGNNIITYAGIFGEGNETHGTEVFADTLPPDIVRDLQRLFYFQEACKIGNYIS